MMVEGGGWWGNGGMVGDGKKGWVGGVWRWLVEK